MTLWAGKAQDAESTLLPKVRSWLRTMAILVQLPSIGDPVGIEGELPAESGHERFERLWIEWGLLPDPSESGQQQCGWQARVERFHIFYHPSHPSSRQSKHLKSVEES